MTANSWHTTKLGVQAGAMRGAIGAIAVLAVVGIMLAWLRLSRRPEPPPDPTRWKESPAEPFGTILLTVFFLGPVIAFVADLVGQSWLVPVGLAALLMAGWGLSGGTKRVRGLAVAADAIEWRTLRGRHRVPLSEVASVSDPERPDLLPAIQLTNGAVLHLPEDPGVRAVTTTLANLVGRVTPPVTPEVQVGTVRWMLPRRLRGHAGVQPSERAYGMAIGPPFLSLDGRASLLLRLRQVLDSRGYELSEAIGPKLRRHLEVATGDAAAATAGADEQTADHEGHWWRHHLVWRRRESRVVYVADPDECDLWFVAWGDDGAATLDALLGVLEKDRT